MASSTPTSALAADFYRTQLLESRVAWISAAIVVFLLFFLVLFVSLSLRGHYIEMFTSQLIGPSFAMMCGLGHSYPFMSKLFFKNPNTADLVVTVFYMQLNKAFPTLSAAQVMAVLVDPASWRDTPNTLVWYSENNATAGVADTIAWAQQQNLLPTPATPITGKDVLNFIQAWVIPAVMMVTMIASAAIS